jgi:hypothetical protein
MNRPIQDTMSTQGHLISIAMRLTTGERAPV